MVDGEIFQIARLIKFLGMIDSKQVYYKCIWRHNAKHVKGKEERKLLQSFKDSHNFDLIVKINKV